MRLGPYIGSLRGALPEAARPFFDPALAGDAEAARRLIAGAPNRLRGHLAFIAYQVQVANPAYREVIGAVWRLDHSLLTEFWQPAVVRRMIARADFEVPAFRGQLTVFRAMSGMSARQAGSSLSWHASRNEAVRLHRGGVAARDPKLVRAIVTRADVIYWGESSGVPGLVTRRPVKAVPEDAREPVFKLRLTAI